jgi:hypothetical protein
MNITLAIATVLMAAALTGILSTNPIVFAQDESETNTEQNLKQKNVGSGNSISINCGINNYDYSTTVITPPVCPTVGLLD